MWRALRALRAPRASNVSSTPKARRLQRDSRAGRASAGSSREPSGTARGGALPGTLKTDMRFRRAGKWEAKRGRELLAVFPPDRGANSGTTAEDSGKPKIRYYHWNLNVRKTAAKCAPATSWRNFNTFRSSGTMRASATVREEKELLAFLQPCARVLEATIHRDPDTEWSTGTILPRLFEGRATVRFTSLTEAETLVSKFSRKETLPGVPLPSPRRIGHGSFAPAHPRLRVPPLGGSCTGQKGGHEAADLERPSRRHRGTLWLPRSRKN